MNQSVMISAVAVLKAEEGFEPHVYVCTEGKETVGIGLRTPIRRSEVEEAGLVDDWQSVGMTEAQAEIILRKRLERMWGRLKFRTKDVDVDTLPHRVQVALCSMVFQMGVDGLLSFKKMWGHIAKAQWIQASQEALRSKWAREQTPGRATRMASMIADEALF